jgi:GTP-binding protein
VQENIRNIAIIAHVDHGKTTLVDAMLRQSGVFRENEIVNERVMDSNDLERERGITILAKNLSVHFEGIKINIVDTPGHADFGGEVERILKMVDSVLLLVDAVDGPMPQTRFVLRKSLELGLRPILVVNKVDRPAANPVEAQSRVFDLFCDLATSEDQLDFPTLFTSARQGTAVRDMGEEPRDLGPLFETIRDNIQPPEGDVNAPFQMLVAHIDYNDYLGRTATGKVANGSVAAGDSVALIKGDGKVVRGRISRLLAHEGLRQVEVAAATCGDIVTIAGLEDVEIGETVSDPSQARALPYLVVDEPTLALNMMVNNSPFAGQEGKYVTSRNIRERLHRELRNNLSLRIEDTSSPDTFRVSGRGELHLGILIENMRREGFEMAVSKPEVIFREVDEVRMEPMECLVVDVPTEHQGAVMACVGPRRVELLSMDQNDNDIRLEFSIPARGLIGLRGELLTETRGTAVMNHVFAGYEPYKGEIPGRRTGALVSMENGNVTAFALESLQDRGRLFVKPGTEVYAGMVVGENAKASDMDVNPVRTKKLTNMRSSNAEIEVKLTPPTILSLEQAMEFINDDELVEVTPDSIRLRKRELNKSFRTKKTAAV